MTDRSRAGSPVAARRYGEAVQVRRRDDAPAEFLRGGRLHVVRAVLAHWVEAGRWWERGGRGDPGVAAPDGTGFVLDDREREVWRVEASAGRLAGTGVFDLCFDWSTGCWWLLRVVD